MLLYKQRLTAKMSEYVRKGGSSVLTLRLCPKNINIQTSALSKTTKTHTAANSVFGPSSKGRPAKNLYLMSERPTVTCRMTWVWSVRLNLNNRPIIIQLLPRNTGTYPTQEVPGPLPDSRVPVIFTGYLPPHPTLTLALKTHFQVRVHSSFA